ncbi:MAG: M56 family metallopeptidase [Sporichthyaceae bacterium]
MLTGIALLTWCGLLAVVVPARLHRAQWSARAPRLALALWQALSVSFLISAVLAGIALADPDSISPGAFAHPMLSCVEAIVGALQTPEGALAVGFGLVLSCVVAGRASWFVATTLAEAAQRRRLHSIRLALVARRDVGLDALIVDHPVPQAYCLPGRNATIVVTSAAVAGLPAADLAAVLAHERAHVTARHHLVVVAASGLARAFPRIALFRLAAEAVPMLIEMAADDSAARRTDRRRVATALAALAGAPVPASALGASCEDTVARVRRLLAPAPLSRASRLTAITAILGVLAVPVATMTASTWAAHQISNCCTALEIPVPRR